MIAIKPHSHSNQFSACDYNPCDVDTKLMVAMTIVISIDKIWSSLWIKSIYSRYNRFTTEVTGVKQFILKLDEAIQEDLEVSCWIAN